MTQFTIDPARMDAVLHKRRITLSFSELMMEYNNYVPKFEPSMVTFLQLADFEQLSHVFGFTTVTVPNMKREFLSWLKEFWPYFHAPDISQVYGRMLATLQSLPEPRPPFINWVPAYGGLLKSGPMMGKEQQWHKTNRVAYAIPDSQDPDEGPLPPRENLRVGE
jgi:hypothetical protein